MRRFKGLDDKSSDFVLKMAVKRRKAIQIGFLDYFFVCKDWYASSDELFRCRWVEMVAMTLSSSVRSQTASHRHKSLRI